MLLIDAPVGCPSWQLFVGCWVHVYGANHVDEWATNELEVEPDPDNWADLALLVGIEAFDGNVPPGLTCIVEKQFPEFDMSTAAAADFAKELWFAFLRQYIAGHGLPDDMQRTVAAIEVTFDYPEWLGDMYHACDCVPNDRVQTPYICAEAKATFEKFA